MVTNFEARRTSFGARAADYDRVRPGYPDAAIRAVIGAGAPVVVDLGSGTGHLGGRSRALGATVVGVEPDPGMAAVAIETLPGLVVRATAERVPLRGGAADAIVVGQAWHWFDHAAAVAECARLLRPGGRLGVFQNVRDESTPWVAAFGDIIGGEDRSRSPARWPFGPGGIGIGPPFEDVVQRNVAHSHATSPADLVTLTMTHSYVSTHPRRDDLIAQVSELVRTDPALAGRGRVELPYICRLTVATRR